MPITNICPNKWPELAFEDLKDTLSTVQLWAQIVGKIRLIKTPWINHSWHVTLYVSPRGLTTGSIPYEGGNFKSILILLVMNLLSQPVTVSAKNWAFTHVR